MSDTKKAKLASAKQAAIAALSQPSFARIHGLGTVVLNAGATTRFPLPLTIGSAILASIGVIAAMRGYRIFGIGTVGIGVIGLGAAAAAPELQAVLSK